MDGRRVTESLHVHTLPDTTLICREGERRLSGREGGMTEREAGQGKLEGGREGEREG